MVLKVVCTLRVSGNYCTFNYCLIYLWSHVPTFSSLTYLVSTQYKASLTARMLTLSADSLQSYVSTYSHPFLVSYYTILQPISSILCILFLFFPIIWFSHLPLLGYDLCIFFCSCSFLFLDQSSQLLSVFLVNFSFFLSEISSRNC